jgi:DNA-directed RNA polymerase subunit RPC12/RpoP
MTKNSKAKYWYLITEVGCPVCGYYVLYKERQYSEKPPLKKDRYRYETAYDGCEGRYW